MLTQVPRLGQSEDHALCERLVVVPFSAALFVDADHRCGISLPPSPPLSPPDRNLMSDRVLHTERACKIDEGMTPRAPRRGFSVQP